MIQPTKKMYVFMIFIKNFTPSIFQIFKIISESKFSKPLSQNGMIDLDSGVQKLIPTQKKDLSQVKIQESRLVQEVSPNQEDETQVHIHFPIMECDFLRLVISVQE